VRHHQDTIKNFTRFQAARPEVRGVAVVGSVARGDERSDSDVDVYVVITDDAYADAERQGRIAFVSHDGVTYAGGTSTSNSAARVIWQQPSSGPTTLPGRRFCMRA